MLRDFGFVTLIDMTVSLGGVLAVLPAVLIAVEQGDPQRWLERVRGRFSGTQEAAAGRFRRRWPMERPGSPSKSMITKSFPVQRTCPRW